MALSTEDKIKLLMISGNQESAEAAEARKLIAKEFAAADSPVLELIAQETTVRNIFSIINFDYDSQIEFVTDVPRCAAYDMPKLGMVPRSQFDGDIILINTFQVVGRSEWTLRQARGKRIDIVKLAGTRVGEAITQHEEDAGWSVLIHAANSNWAGAGMIPAANAPILQVPDAAKLEGGAGFFSKELINLMSIHMERQGKTLTHVYISPEDEGDVRMWSANQVSYGTRDEIFKQGAGVLNGMWGGGVNYVKTKHLGLGAYSAGQYNMQTNVNPITKEALNNSAVTTGYTQVYGFDLRPNFRERHFVMPQRGAMVGHDDPTMITELKAGVIVEEEIGFAVLDNRAICVGNINRNVVA